MSTATAELMSRGMACLQDSLGVVDAEKFISLIIREQFDYTKWQQEHFDKITAEKIMESVDSYATSHPHSGAAKLIL